MGLYEKWQTIVTLLLKSCDDAVDEACDVMAASATRGARCSRPKRAQNGRKPVKERRDREASKDKERFCCEGILGQRRRRRTRGKTTVKRRWRAEERMLSKWS